MHLSTDRKLQRPPKLSEQVAELLADEIERGVFAPGEALPSEAGLASELGVSRTIVREALARLEFEGVLESRKGSKAKVAVSGKRRVFTIRETARLDAAGLGQLYEFRAVLEGGAAALAARRGSEADLLRLRACLATLDEAVEARKDEMPANVLFHQLIAEASRNVYLKDFMKFLNLRLWEQIKGDRDLLEQRGMPAELQKEHSAIVEAIEQGDPEGARRAVVAHISNAARRRNIAIDVP